MLVCIIIFAVTIFGVRLYCKRKVNINKRVIQFIVLLEAIGCAISVYDYVDCNYFPSHEIERKAAGEGTRVESIIAQIKKLDLSEEITLDVDDVEYSEKQARNILEQATKEVEEQFLGENTSLDYVIYDVVLSNSAQEGLVQVKWDVDNDKIVDSRGCLQVDQMKCQQTLVTATAILTLENYESVDTISFMVCQPKEGTKESVRRELLHKLLESNNENNANKDFILPDKIQNYEITWKKSEKRRGEMISLLGVAAAIAIIVGEKEERRRKKEKYRKEMLMDYPDIVSGIALLISAGVSSKGAWNRISKQYQKQKRKRVGYEEVLKTFYEMEDGVSEIQAYENFANRIPIREYRKLSMLLIQNITRGTIGISEKLQQEEERVFENRKTHARRIGEEAGTKLLIPMMLLLGVVMVILIVPAMLEIKI